MPYSCFPGTAGAADGEVLRSGLAAAVEGPGTDLELAVVAAGAAASVEDSGLCEGRMLAAGTVDGADEEVVAGTTRTSSVPVLTG